MKRILHVIEGMNAGGMETLIMNYYRKIDKNKYQFDFLINKKEKVFYEDEIKSLGGKIYRNVLPKENIIKNRKELNDLFKNNKYDVVHCHQGITYYYPLKMAKKYNVKNRIIHNHGINHNFLKYLYLYNQLWAKKRISYLGNNYIACSKEVLDHIFTKKIINKKNYTILPNAIDIKNFKFDNKKREKIRKEFNLGEELTFIHVGTFTTPKNHEFIIDLINEYNKINANFKLLLVGEGPLKENIKEKVNKLNLNDKVIFTGIRNDIPSLLSAADIMLFPSLYESFGIAALESQASGLLTIISDNFPNDILLTDIIKSIPLNIDKWINEINNADLKNKREKYNIELLKTNYDINNSLKTLEKLYERK